MQGAVPHVRSRVLTAARPGPVLAMSVASVLAPLNSSMIAVALPDIRRDMGVGVGAATWLVATYLIAVAVAQPLGGRLGDAFGCRKIVMLGLSVLVVCSLAAAAAWNLPVLIVTRSLQGVSAALVMPNALAYLRKSIRPGQLGSALGTTGAAISAGAAVGPVAGGLLLAAGSWRYLFLANVPVALAGLVLVAALEADRGRGRGGFSIDLVSLVALAGGFTGMALLGSSSQVRSGVLVTLSVAVFPVSAIVYALRYRLAGQGVVDLRLFSRNGYAAPAASVALGNLVMYTALIAVPVYLADVRHRPDAEIGAMLFMLSAAVVGISPFAGRMSDRFGPRRMMIAGAVSLLAGATGLAAVLHDPPVLLLGAPLLLIGAGLGLAQAAQQSAALRAWPAAMAGSASGTFSMMRYVGSVTGTALIAAILAGHPRESEFRELFLGLAGFAILNLVASLLMRPEGVPPESEHVLRLEAALPEAD